MTDSNSTAPDTNALLAARQERGEQLRALVISWQENKTFVHALAEQSKAVEEGKFKLNEDWCIMADEILGAYMSQPKLTAWDEEKPDDGPKLVLPS